MRQQMRQTNLNDVRIVTSQELKYRSFIVFYHNGKRVKLYNGSSLGLNIKPNLAKSISEKNSLLKKLEFELLKLLDNDEYPLKSTKKPLEKQIINTGELLKMAISKKLNQNLNKFYIRNLKWIYNAFIKYLDEDILNSPIENLNKSIIESFLSHFNSSATYYMNKRRDLGVLFSTINKFLDREVVTIKNTDAFKTKAVLHQIYEPKELKLVLDFLKINHPNLYLCAILCFGCFLRPHEEIRNLTTSDFKKNISEIHLSGNQNKGKRIRTVHIPKYVKEILLDRISALKPEDNIFSLSPTPFNDAYFNTAWTRQWRIMFKKGIIKKNQTLYSFRHTAVVQVYRKTKDLNIIQQLLGHSDMLVTLKYLRGLGEATNEELKNVMPILEF